MCLRYDTSFDLMRGGIEKSKEWKWARYNRKLSEKSLNCVKKIECCKWQDSGHPTAAGHSHTRMDDQSDFAGHQINSHASDELAK